MRLSCFVLASALSTVLAVTTVIPAPLNPDGTVADTPEVKAAKLKHLVLLAKAGAPVSDSNTQYTPLTSSVPRTQPNIHKPNSISPQHKFSQIKTKFQPNTQLVYVKPPFGPYTYSIVQVPQLNTMQHGSLKWQGTAAPINQDGTVADTPEVQKAKAVHLAAYADVVSRLPKKYQSQNLSRSKRQTLSQQLFNPAPSTGAVAETSEVKSVKSKLSAAHGEAARYAAARSSNSAAFDVASHRKNVIPGSGKPKELAVPLDRDGAVAETPEVRHAIEANFAALAQFLIKYPIDPEIYYYTSYQRPSQFKLAAPDHDDTAAEIPKVQAKSISPLAEYHKTLSNLY